MTDHVHVFTREGSIGYYGCACGAYQTATQHVLEALAGDPCEGIAGLMVNRRVNTSPGWRHSDAARAEVRYHADAGCDAYRASYEAGKGN